MAAAQVWLRERNIMIPFVRHGREFEYFSTLSMSQKSNNILIDPGLPPAKAVIFAPCDQTLIEAMSTSPRFLAEALVAPADSRMMLKIPSAFSTPRDTNSEMSFADSDAPPWPSTTEAKNFEPSIAGNIACGNLAEAIQRYIATLRAGHVVCASETQALIVSLKKVKAWPHLAEVLRLARETDVPMAHAASEAIRARFEPARAHLPSRCTKVTTEQKRT